MWEITLQIIAAFRSNAIEFIESINGDDIKTCMVEKDGDYILSIAVQSEKKEIISQLRLAIAKFIISTTKYDYFINNLFLYCKSSVIRQFIAKIMVSLGSEYEVLSCLYKLNYSYINVASFVRFVLKDVVASWDKVILGLNQEFSNVSDTELVIEFLKYIVSVTNADNETVFLDVLDDTYIVSTQFCGDTVIDKEDKAGLIVSILNYRPKNLVIKNASAFDKDMYIFLKYVFNSKLSVEV